MLTIRGWALACSSGEKAWIMAHAPYRLTSITCRDRSRSAPVAVSDQSTYAAALLTRTSRRPNDPATAARAASTELRSLTSRSIGSALIAPTPRTASAAAWASLAARALSSTSAPRRPSSSATARPRPREEPVIRHTGS